MNDVVVKKSKIHGRGVFAKRQFRRGEVVMQWDVAQRVTKKQLVTLTPKDKTYLNRDAHGHLILLKSPERYVNHSSRPNTRVKGAADVAIRTIKTGEEITSDYTLEGKVPENMMYWKP
ncbi:MAG: SET domain-containing protein [Candidatus Kerfeldbacteria bacterium]|nr:SET domain-containing protein [Candidatus Kerfeldbacteria bacterium]